MFAYYTRQQGWQRWVQIDTQQKAWYSSPCSISLVFGNEGNLAAKIAKTTQQIVKYL
jgi:hypothetical protein